MRVTPASWTFVAALVLWVQGSGVSLVQGSRVWWVLWVQQEVGAGSGVLSCPGAGASPRAGASLCSPTLLPAPKPLSKAVFFLICFWFASKVVTLHASPTWECT